MNPPETLRTDTVRHAFLLATVAAVALGAPAAVMAQTAPVSAPGHADAEAAYRDMAQSRFAEAAVAAARAVEAAPDNLDWRLLLSDARTAAGDPAGALSALQPVAGAWDHRVQSRRAEAARAAGDLAQAEEAYALAAPLAPTAGQRAYLARARIQVLVQQGRRAEARAALNTAHDTGVLPGDAPLDFAYVAVATGEDRLAVQAFATADAATPLRGAQALDAAYAARRAGADRTAVAWLEQGARTLDPAELTPQRRHEIGREIQTLEHRVGGTVSVLTGPSTASSALVASPDDSTTQAGAEAWVRLGGDNNGRPVQAFVRAYQTLESDTGPVSGDSTQAWVGLRWKPLTQTNLIVEASRMIAVGDAARDDTAIRAAWSAETGNDLRYDRDSWPSARVYVDATRLLEDQQTFAVADGSIGWTWVASSDRRNQLSAGVGVRADYDSARADTVSVAAGPRLALRRWIGGSDLRVPDRYVDVSVGYDVQIGDSPRDDGLVAAITFGF